MNNHRFKIVIKNPFNMIGSLLFLGLFVLGACKETKTEQKEVLIKEKYILQTNEVDFMVLKKQTFKEELLANGKLVALQKNVLKFEVSGALEKLNVKNGDYVRKGQTLAALQAFKYRQQLDKAESIKKRRV